MRTATSPAAPHVSRFMLHVLGLLSLASAFLSPLPARGAEIPPPVLPAGVGVNIHFVTGHEKDLDMIAAAGFKFIRMDFHWSGDRVKERPI